MFSNQNIGYGLVLAGMAMMALLVSPLIKGLGASLVIQFVIGLGAILLANHLFAPKKGDTSTKKVED